MATVGLTGGVGRREEGQGAREARAAACDTFRGAELYILSLFALRCQPPAFSTNSRKTSSQTAGSWHHCCATRRILPSLAAPWERERDGEKRLVLGYTTLATANECGTTCPSIPDLPPLIAAWRPPRRHPPSKDRTVVPISRNSAAGALTNQQVCVPRNLSFERGFWVL